MRIINKILGIFGIIIINKNYGMKLLQDEICLLEIKKFIVENPALFQNNTILEKMIMSL